MGWNRAEKVFLRFHKWHGEKEELGRTKPAALVPYTAGAGDGPQQCSKDATLNALHMQPNASSING
jgi:hypothetical protein